MKSIIQIKLQDIIIGMALIQALVLFLGIVIGVNIHSHRIQTQVEEKGYVYVHRGPFSVAFSQTERDMIMVGMTMTWPWKPSRVNLPNYFQLVLFDEMGRQNIIAIGRPKAGEKTNEKTVAKGE